jgi:hypothetical protein
MGPKGIGNANLFESCYLDARNFSTLTLGLTYRDQTAMVAGGTGGTATLSGVQVAVLSREYQGGAPTANMPYVQESQRQFDLTNLAGLDVPFRNAPTGQWMRRQTFKTTVGATTYADPSDGVIYTTQRAEGAHIKAIQQGNFSWLDTTYLHLKAQDKIAYGLESIPVGYATVECIGGGGGGTPNAWNLRSVTTLDNKADITFTNSNTNTLQITDEQVCFAPGT